MANITIYELHSTELEYAELSELEMEAVMGGVDLTVKGDVSQENGATVKVGIKGEPWDNITLEASGGYNTQSGGSVGGSLTIRF